MAKSVVACPSCGQKNRLPEWAEGTPSCASCKSPLPWVVDAGDADFGEIADRSKLPVLVDLWAPWCGPCRMVSPALEKLAADLAGQFKLVKVNVDQAPRLARRFNAQSIPTLVVLSGGRELGRQVGASPPPQLRRWLEGSLKKAGRPAKPGSGKPGS